ncbi:MAG TPA: SH3 domain-containing protein [Candidatus Sericytochromatia bacterium]
MSFRSSVFGLSVLVATSSLSFFAHPLAAQPRNAAAQPQVATVKSMVNGDLMCYVTLVDENGIKYREVGATFEICAKKDAFLNKKVNLVYAKVSVNDCQSAEPCGKTRQQTLILQMKVAGSDERQSCHRGASAGYTIERLKVGMTGHSLVNIRLRQQPGVASPSLTTLSPGNNFEVVEGPKCVNSYVWWKVNTGKVQGWVAEADPATFKYWLAPNMARN